MSVLTVFRNTAVITIPFEGTPVLGDLLLQHGLGVHRPCGGRGVCGKCLVRVRGLASGPNQEKSSDGKMLACQTVLLGDCEVILNDSSETMQIETEGIELTAFRESGGKRTGQYGTAVDIGTTTVALKLCSMTDGKLLAEAAELNPQTQIAADVIGRIGAALEGKAAWLQTAIRECIERLTLNVCLRAGIEPDRIGESVITGNTAMLHLLTGQDTEPLSHAPFHAETLFGTDYSGLAVPAYLPPCMDAFVGADITCAVLASGMCDREETALLTDIGTNGEVALLHGGKLYVTSTAAGPAFEGVGIACGCGSITGAIDRVWNENGKLAVHTIGEGAPVGLCGSGLIDAVAALLEQEWIDETGATETDSVQIAGEVILTARDVRNVQLAKGAIAAGIQTVLHEAGIGFNRITVLYIAGGFGNHLNFDSAAAIGLIPQCLKDRVRTIGNAALSGAEALLLDPRNREKAERIAALVRPVHLGGNPVFTNYYMECMIFETY